MHMEPVYFGNVCMNDQYVIWERTYSGPGLYKTENSQKFVKVICIPTFKDAVLNMRHLPFVGQVDLADSNCAHMVNPSILKPY